jgi:hypothetical protein
MTWRVIQKSGGAAGKLKKGRERVIQKARLSFEGRD